MGETVDVNYYGKTVSVSKEVAENLELSRKQMRRMTESIAITT